MVNESSAGDIIHFKVKLKVEHYQGGTNHFDTIIFVFFVFGTGNAFEHAPRNFFAIPHAMALASDLGLLCVADRENGRVQCFNTGNGTFHSQFHSGIIGDRLFSVAYAPINGGQLYVVNGPDPQSHHTVMGFIIHMQTNSVVAKFGPKGGAFDNPHDIIVSPGGNEVSVAKQK